AIFAAFLALGFLFVHLASSQSLVNVYNVLFGNVLGISDGDVRVILATTLLALVLAAIAGRPLLFGSIDPDVAAVRGVRVDLLGLGYLLVFALVVAVAVQIVGVLLIFSLMITPAATAQHLTPRPSRAIALSVLFALLFTWIGLVAGYVTDYPVSF